VCDAREDGLPGIGVFEGYGDRVKPRVAARRGRIVLLSVVLSVVLIGCSQAAAPSIPSPSSTGTSVSSTRSVPVASATPTSTEPPSLGGTCDDLLTVQTVDVALGRAVLGKTSFVVGVPEPKIGRLAYINCQYGLHTVVMKKKKITTNLVEIGASLYDSTQQALRRVQGTIGDYLSNGSTKTDVPVNGFVVSILLGYGDPTAVVAAGPRSAAITVNAKLLGTRTREGLTSLAKAVLDATAQYAGAPGASDVATDSVTPSPGGS
jgi:hypothetical protein